MDCFAALKEKKFLLQMFTIMAKRSTSSLQCCDGQVRHFIEHNAARDWQAGCWPALASFYLHNHMITVSQ